MWRNWFNGKKKSEIEKQKQKVLGATDFKEQYTYQITVVQVLSLFFFLSIAWYIYFQLKVCETRY